MTNTTTDLETDPRVQGYDFLGYSIERLPENTLADHPYYVKGGWKWISRSGEVIFRCEYYPTFRAALIALLRYEHSRRPEVELRVVPCSGNWEKPGCWCISNGNLVAYYRTNGKSCVLSPYGIQTFPTPEAALLALIEWRERQAGEPIAPPARRWEVERHRVQEDAYCVTDGKSNYLNNNGAVSPHPYYVNEWLAVASADRANAIGPHPPEPPKWRKEWHSGGTNVYFGDEYRATFSREADAHAWMEAQRDGGQRDE